MIRRGLALVAALSLGALAAHAEAMISTNGLKASQTDVSIGTVTAEKDGYVIVHRTDFTGTLPGEVIGQAPVKAGANAEVRVTLDKQPEPGTKLIVMLHEEGDGDTDFDAADKPVKANGAIVQQTVTVE